MSFSESFFWMRARGALRNPVRWSQGLGLVLLGSVWSSGCNSSEPSPEDGVAGGGGTPVATGGALTGGSGGSGGTGGSLGGTGGTVPMGPPELLSETGLYEADMETLAEGVMFFEPRFKLWSDTAEKRRWVKLPEGEQIDTSDMDYWNYPVGTKLWKEFTRDGVRVETRLLQKQPSGGWWMVAYQWRDDQNEADAVPDGVDNASGTPHDIPSSKDCESCHTKLPDKVLGFTALQLAHESTGLGGAGGGGSDVSSVTLSELDAQGWLSDSPLTDLSLPGTPTDRAALGYLHANCGNCHNPKSSTSVRVNMHLWLTVDDLGSLEDTPTYRTTVDASVALPEGPEDATHRIVPGDPSKSDVFLRMTSSRGETYSMPALGTEMVDPEGTSIVEDWIFSLE